MAVVIEFLIFIFLVLPIVYLIHEYGHVFFIKLFGGEVHKITFGFDRLLFRIGKVLVYKTTPYYGRVHFSIGEIHKYKSLLISAGGIIFNIISASLAWYAISKNIVSNFIFIRGFIYTSYFLAFLTMYPQTYHDGFPSDGKYIMDLLFKK